MYMCESQKYDMEFEVRKRGFEVFLSTWLNLNFKCTFLCELFCRVTTKCDNKMWQQRRTNFNFKLGIWSHSLLSLQSVGAVLEVLLKLFRWNVVVKWPLWRTSYILLISRNFRIDLSKRLSEVIDQSHFELQNEGCCQMLAIDDSQK